MEIFLWVLGIHLIELLGVGVFFLIKKNIALEKIATQQQQYINDVDFVVSQLISNLSKIDQRVYVDGDSELEEIFTDINDLKGLLENISKK
jgi:predicted methyltransferase